MTPFHRWPRLALALCAALAWLAAPAAAADPDPQALFARMKAASGGERWDRIGEIEYEAALRQGGEAGRVRVRRDLVGGRHRVRSDLGVQHGERGYDGRDAWMRDEKGLVTVLDGAAARREALTDAYLARNGWFAPPARDPAAMAYLGERRDGDARYHVVEVTPARGATLAAWLDARTGLLARLHRRGDDGRETVLHYGDYREVDGVRLPFSVRQSEGDARYDSLLRLTRVRTRPVADAARFARPASAVRDARIAGGARRTTVPFELYAGKILVSLSIDGGAPLPFLLDTGGLNLLTPAAARALGLRGEGEQPVQGAGEGVQSLQTARVGRYRLGQVELDDQRFLIVELPQLLVERGDKPPIAGLIGYELLRRFTVRIDYDARLLTVSPAGGLAGTDAPDVLALSFDDRTPQATARVDGAEGLFALDTGSGSGLSLLAPFAAGHGIVLDADRAGMMGGVGGHVRIRTGQVRRFELGPHALPRPSADIVEAKAGVFASRLLAGNVGQAVLSRFVLTFDYDSRRLRVEPGRRFAEPFETPATLGFGLDRVDRTRFRVLHVAEGSAAAGAGVRAGDVVTALGGEPAERFDLDELQALLRRSARSGLDLSIQAEDGTERIVRVPPAAPGRR